MFEFTYCNATTTVSEKCLNWLCLGALLIHCLPPIAKSKLAAARGSCC